MTAPTSPLSTPLPPSPPPHTHTSGVLRSIVLIKWKISVWPYSDSPWISYIPNLDNAVEFLEATCVSGRGLILAWGSPRFDLACTCRGDGRWSPPLVLMHYCVTTGGGEREEQRCRHHGGERVLQDCCETSLILTSEFHGIPGSSWPHGWPGNPPVWSRVTSWRADLYNNHLFHIWIHSTPLSLQKKIILNIHDANEESIESTEI